MIEIKFKPFRVSFGKYDASIKNNVAKTYLPVNAKKGTPLAQENANTEYTLEVVYKPGTNIVQHWWLVDKQPIKY